MQLRAMLQRCAFAVAALLFCVPARADDSFTAKTQIYTDSDRTTVVSPLAAISRDAWLCGMLIVAWRRRA